MSGRIIAFFALLRPRQACSSMNNAFAACAGKLFSHDRRLRDLLRLPTVIYRRQKRARRAGYFSYRAGNDRLGAVFSYAIGKLVNGFVADHANVVRYMSLGLLLSAGMNLMMGMTSNALLLAVFWGINGWAQSMGSVPVRYRWPAGTGIKSAAPLWDLVNRPQHRRSADLHRDRRRHCGLWLANGLLSTAALGAVGWRCCCCLCAIHRKAAASRRST